MPKKEKEIIYNITPDGSLGLLALGAEGIRAWRNAQQNAGKNPKKKST